MTNPGLMKRFFNRKAKIGDKSKSLVVEPHYALVFTGRLPYQTRPVSRVVAWLPPKSEIFKVYIRNACSEQVETLLAESVPEGSHIINMQDDLYSALNILNRLAVIPETEFVTYLITRLNSYLRFLTEKEVWEKIDQNPDRYSNLWKLDRELTGIDNKIGVQVITRRLMS